MFFTPLYIYIKYFTPPEEHATSADLYYEPDDNSYLYAIDAQSGCHLEGIAPTGA